MFQVTVGLKQTAQRLSSLKQRFRIISHGSSADWAHEGGSCWGLTRGAVRCWPGLASSEGQAGWDIRGGSLTWPLLMLATSWEFSPHPVASPRGLGFAAWQLGSGRSSPRASVPRSRKQRQPGQLRAVLGPGSVSFLLVKDSRSWRKKTWNRIAGHLWKTQFTHKGILSGGQAGERGALCREGALIRCPLRTGLRGMRKWPMRLSGEGCSRPQLASSKSLRQECAGHGEEQPR